MAVSRIQIGVQKLAAGVIGLARGGKEAQTITSHLHGKYWEAAMNGQLFTASSVIAGLVMPVAAATLNSKWTIWNPAGSGVVVEMISFTTGLDTATQVVNGWGLAIQRNLTTTGGGIPTSVTAATSLALGAGGSSKVTVATQATLTNVAIPGVTAATAVPIPLYPMFSSGATTAAGIYNCSHDFDGRVLLNPDDLGAVCTTVAAAAQNWVSFVWAEYPI